MMMVMMIDDDCDDDDDNDDNDIDDHHHHAHLIKHFQLMIMTMKMIVMVTRKWRRRP